MMARFLLFAAAACLLRSSEAGQSFEEAVLGQQHHDPLTLALLQKDSPCSDAPTVTKDACLSKPHDCMFIETDVRNLCLPCKLGPVNIPCVPVGSVYAMKTVKDCQMNCAHQELITKASACTDVSGGTSITQCFAKGTTAFTSCMWTTYSDAAGKAKNICGPCTVMGIGKIPCYAPGNLGPEAGSTVNGCVSMCESGTTEWGIPCGAGLGIPAVTDCHPVPLPPAPPPAPIPLTALRIATAPDAPEYFAADVPPPYGVKQYTMASEVAAMAAGWPAPGEDLPPDSPVVIYGSPPFEGPTLPPQLKVMYGPAPPGIPGVPAPGYGMGTAPPPENVKAAAAQKLLQLRSETRTKKDVGGPRNVPGDSSGRLARSKLRLRRRSRWAEKV